MKKGDLAFLAQLVNSSEQSVLELEKAYDADDAELFNKVKTGILNFTKEISETLNEK